MNKRLTRSATDKQIGGVCGGVAEYLGWDATLIRIAAVVLLILGFGTMAIVYLVCWAVMPEGPSAPTMYDAPPPPRT